MAIRELDKTEFLATFAEPMRDADNDEAAKPVNIGSYVTECIQKHHLPTNLEEVEIQHVYINAKNKYVHVVNYYGEANRYLVIVIDNEEEQPFGYYFLDLNEEYSL